MPLGKRADGTTVGPSPAQRSINARRIARYPLRLVVDEFASKSIDLGGGRTVDIGVVELECGHKVSPPKDMIGRRYPERMRCRKCDPKPCEHEWRDRFGGGRRCAVCELEEA